MGPELSSLLAGYPVIIALPVQWGDQDAFGHVNNSIYFRWYESARIAYTIRLGFPDLKLIENIGPILASITCDYRRQVTFPDTVHVGSRVTRIGRTSFGMEHALVSEAAQAVAAEGSSTIVLYDYNAQKPYPVSQPIRQAIEAIEGRSF